MLGRLLYYPYVVYQKTVMEYILCNKFITDWLFRNRRKSIDRIFFKNSKPFKYLSKNYKHYRTETLVAIYQLKHKINTSSFYILPIWFIYFSKLSQSTFVRQKIMALSILCSLIARKQYSPFNIFIASERVSVINENE